MCRLVRASETGAYRTANGELGNLVQRGDPERVERDGTTWYVPNRTRLLFEATERLVEENTKAERRVELERTLVSDAELSFGRPYDGDERRGRRDR